MKKHRNAAALLFPFLLAIALSPAFAEAPRPNLKLLVQGNNAFALDLYAILSKEKGNLFFSPYSISSALAMTYGGARGETAKEMANALHFTLDSDRTHAAFHEIATAFDKIQEKGQVHLHIANSLWPQKSYPLQQAYLELTKQYYGVSITPVDYMNAAEEARQLINEWVEDKTESKIKDLIRSGALDPTTVLVLINAIYFKGNWASQFDPKRTMWSDFFPLDDAKKSVAMMCQMGKFGYAEIEGAQLLELPYVGKALSMVILLPKKHKGFSKIENQLSIKNLGIWLSRISEQEVNVFLPKFKITWGTFKLNQPLQTLGMRTAFNSMADFSGMDGTRSLFIDKVLHKAFIDVNEEGTEAAAATAVIVGRGVSKIQIFRADHPFIFLIRDNVAGSILFLGRMIDPSK